MKAGRKTKGAFSVVEINERLEETIKDVRHSRFLLKPRARMIARNLKKLKDARFGNRVIKEASEKPRGKVALTLRYGRKKAKRMLLERARRRIGPLRTRHARRKRRRARYRCFGFGQPCLGYGNTKYW